MQTMTLPKLLATLTLALTLFPAAADTPPATHGTQLNAIAAVVNDDVITRRELDMRITEISQQLQKRGTPLPPRPLLEKQLLDRMIMDTLLMQYARETGVRVDDEQLDKAMLRVAQGNNFSSVAQFRAKLEKDGINFQHFREEIRNEIISTRLREREVDSKLVISDSEVNNYLATAAGQKMQGMEYHLAHIYVIIPDQASAAQVQARQKRIDDAMAQINKGVSFAQVVASYSDDKDAMQGGDLGWRPATMIPTVFLEALQKLKPGEVSQVFHTTNGFHILKLLDRRRNDAPALIMQTHVRHILIKTSDRVSDREAEARLNDIKKRIESGAGFAEQAKQYSEDSSAAQGGDLGWVSSGDTVPEFEKTMNALQPGEMSGLVQTGFGWHLIQVLDRRTADVSEEQKRQQARMAIRSFKSDDAWQDWQRVLRDRAYVENRLEPAETATK
jgi:peptidyl-prolyl cis-trans isomerase SurA